MVDIHSAGIILAVTANKLSTTSFGSVYHNNGHIGLERAYACFCNSSFEVKIGDYVLHSSERLQQQMLWPHQMNREDLYVLFVCGILVHVKRLTSLSLFVKVG